MKHSYLSSWLTIVYLVLICISCAEESQVGYELIGDGELSVAYTEDVTLSSQTIRVDSLLGFTTNFFLGNVSDPSFGKISSTVYLNTFIPDGLIPDYRNGALDSIVLTLFIDRTLTFGNSDASHNLTVFELLEVIPNDTIYSNQNFQKGLVEIGRKENVISSEIDTVRIPDLMTDSTFIQVNDIIRIPLSRALGRRLFNDTTAHQDLESIREIFAGIVITSDTNDGIFALTTGQFPMISYITLYYHDEDRNYEGYNYLFGPRFSNYERDYAGSQVESVLGIPTPENEFCYVQGLAGPNVEIDLGGIRDLGDVILNHVSLEIVEADILGRDTSSFPVAERLTLVKFEDGDYQNIVDLGLNFGGIRTFDLDRSLNIYEMNITSHCLGILNGNEPEVLYLRVTDEIRNPSSAILYGPNHPEFPMKLKVTYTVL